MNIRLLGVVWLMMTSAAFAADCSVSAQDINFGEYDLVSALDSSGTLTVSCRKTKSGNETVNYTLSLSVGAGSYGGRELRNGGSTMFYNLYSDVSRTVVWGDGGGAARVSGRIRMRLFMSNASADHTVYGRIPGNQGDLEAGLYSSPAPIVVTLEY